MSTRFSVQTSALRRLRNPDALFEANERVPTARTRSLPPLEPAVSTPRAQSKQQNRLHDQVWDHRFNVSFSKDNDKYHWITREYFDSPKLPITESLYVTSVSPLKKPITRSGRRRVKRQPNSQWQHVYLPLSMHNTKKHPGLRTYF